jgi:tryptophan-rich sensory protein
VISRSKAPLLLLAVAVLIAIIALLLPPIPQPLAYHNFADHRGWLGIPNFGDVVSNIPFALVGICGLIFLLHPNSETFSDRRERWLYLVMFAGLILTAFGSAYYHLAPGNERLVWDRIPIMMVFMALLAAVIAERVSVVAGLWLFPALEAAGIGSVLLWRAGELQGHGDLRFYAAVQVYAILILLLLLLVPAKYTRGSDFAAVVGFYVLAKILEESDRQVFALGHIVSGHTLKHLAAAAAGYWILRMLQKREQKPCFNRFVRGFASGSTRD